jgi:hypothetical protein
MSTARADDVSAWSTGYSKSIICRPTFIPVLKGLRSHYPSLGSRYLWALFFLFTDLLR